MIRRIPALVVSVVVGSALYGGLGALREPGNVEQEIEKIERQREEALVRKDMKALERIYDDDYTLITVGGERRTRADVMGGIALGSLVVQAMQRSQTSVRVYGDVAVQTSLDSFRMRDSNTPPTGQKWVTRIYVKRSSGWRLAHVHDTLASR